MCNASKSLISVFLSLGNLKLYGLQHRNSGSLSPLIFQVAKVEKDCSTCWTSCSKGLFSRIVQQFFSKLGSLTYTVLIPVYSAELLVKLFSVEAGWSAEKWLRKLRLVATKVCVKMPGL